MWRFPLDALARRRYEGADLSLFNHLHRMQTILRPFIEHNHGTTLAPRITNPHSGALLADRPHWVASGGEQMACRTGAGGAT